MLSRIRQNARDTQMARANRQMFDQSTAESTCPPPFLASPPLLHGMSLREIEAQREMKGQQPTPFTLSDASDFTSPLLGSRASTNQGLMSTSEQSCLFCEQAANMKMKNFCSIENSRNASNDPVNDTADRTQSQPAEVTSSLSRHHTCCAEQAPFTKSARSATTGLQVRCQHGMQVSFKDSKKRKGLTRQRLDHETFSNQPGTLPGSPKLGSPMASLRDRDRMLFSPMAPMIDHSKLSNQQTRDRLGSRSPPPLFERTPMDETILQRMLHRRRANESMVFPRADVPVAKVSRLGDPNPHARCGIRFYYDLE